MKWIAQGPHNNVVKYHFCDRVTQNNGVVVIAKTMQIASAKDNKPTFGELSFYGVIKEIWELNYNMFSTVLFKCDWVENRSGLKIDENGHTLVDFNRIGHKSDCFILASQAKQIFYVSDQMDWRGSAVYFIPLKDYKKKQ